MATNKFNVNQTRYMSTFDLLGSKGDELNRQAYLYNLVYNNHFNYLLNIVTNLFTWDGMPKSPRGFTIRSSFVEQQLAVLGTASISDTTQYGIIFTPCTVVGLLNIWGEPDKIRLTPPFNVNNVQSLNIELTAPEDKFVFMRNDNTCTGFYPLILQVCESLTMIYMAFMSNVNQQKFPVVVSASKEQAISMEVLTNKIDSFEQYIHIKDNGGMDLSKMGVLNKDMPYVGEKLWQAYTDVLNNFFMRVGINMLPNAKKERMLVDEVNSNNQAVQQAGEIFLQCRLQVCEQAKEILGLDLSVKRNTDFIDSLSVKDSPMGEMIDEEVSVYE